VYFSLDWTKVTCIK